MADSSIFDEPRDNSLVKSEIVAKYFWAWAKVIIPTSKKRSNKIGVAQLGDDSRGQGHGLVF